MCKVRGRGLGAAGEDIHGIGQARLKQVLLCLKRLDFYLTRKVLNWTKEIPREQRKQGSRLDESG